MTCDWEIVKKGGSYWHWDSQLLTHAAIVPRKEGVKGIRWYTCPKVAMQTHTFNAWEEKTAAGTTLHLDQFITESGWLSQFPDIRQAGGQEMPPFGERWSFDVDTPRTEFRITRLINHIGGMPTIDPRWAMKRNRHFWFGTNNPALGPMLESGPKGPPFTCVGHFDESTGKLNFWYAGPNSAPEEPHFVPRSADAPEGDGWILTMVGRRAENRTDLAILDALHLDRGPVALVKFPYRVHEGFHGTWVGASALGI